MASEISSNTLAAILLAAGGRVEVSNSDAANLHLGMEVRVYRLVDRDVTVFELYDPRAPIEVEIVDVTPLALESPR